MFFTYSNIVLNDIWGYHSFTYWKEVFASLSPVRKDFRSSNYGLGIIYLWFERRSFGTVFWVEHHLFSGLLIHDRFSKIYLSKDKYVSRIGFFFKQVKYYSNTKIRSLENLLPSQACMKLWEKNVYCYCKNGLNWLSLRFNYLITSKVFACLSTIVVFLFCCHRNNQLNGGNLHNFTLFSCVWRYSSRSRFFKITFITLIRNILTMNCVI